MRISIVGADSKAWAKIPDGEKKVKDAIYQILLDHASLIQDENAILPDKVDYSNITVVSGHCPVGDEREYCVTHNEWFDVESKNGCFYKFSKDTHNVIKVYDQGGVDTWAEIIATELDLKKRIYPAEVNQFPDKQATKCPKCGEERWEKISYHPHFKSYLCLSCGKNFDAKLKGYRSRNIQIAEACDVLYDIEPAGSCKHCRGGYKMISYGELGPEPSFIKCKFCEGDGAYSGGTWTLKYARKLGREVHKVIIK